MFIMNTPRQDRADKFARKLIAYRAPIDVTQVARRLGIAPHVFLTYEAYAVMVGDGLAGERPVWDLVCALARAIECARVWPFSQRLGFCCHRALGGEWIEARFEASYATTEAILIGIPGQSM
jgi:hypothetical protein